MVPSLPVRSEKKDYNFGYNAQTGEYVDLVAAGVIDPVKVVRIALQDAASAAGLLIMTEAMIAEKPKKETAMPRCRAAAWTTKPRHFEHAHKGARQEWAPFLWQGSVIARRRRGDP